MTQIIIIYLHQLTGYYRFVNKFQHVNKNKNQNFVGNVPVSSYYSYKFDISDHSDWSLAFLPHQNVAQFVSLFFCLLKTPKPKTIFQWKNSHWAHSNNQIYKMIFHDFDVWCLCMCWCLLYTLQRRSKISLSPVYSWEIFWTHPATLNLYESNGQDVNWKVWPIGFIHFSFLSM